MQHGTEQNSVLSEGARRSATAEPLDSCGCIVTSDRDRRAVEWLKGQVGPDAVADAVDKLAGNRRPYPSNVAKVLGLSLPPVDQSQEGPPGARKGPPSPEVRRRLQESLKALNASLSASILAAQEIQRNVQRLAQ